MNKAIFKKTCVISIFCIATLLFMLSIPMTSHGGDYCNDFDIVIRANVAANIINITSLENTDHAVVVHTNQYYPAVDLDSTQIFVNNGEVNNDGTYNDCEIELLSKRMDSNGNLDISFQLDDLKDCEDYLEINSEFNILRIEGVKTDGTTFCGESDMHIVGKQGPGK